MVKTKRRYPYMSAKHERRLIQKKRQYRQNTKREARTTIVSFRLRKTEAKLLAKDLRSNPVKGINSIKQFARMIIIDYARQRVVYVNSIDRKISPDARQGLLVGAKAPDCRMSDTHFVRQLRHFIRNVDNWRKLRLFMLRVGWPGRLGYLAKITTNEQKRLQLAQQVLLEMLKPHGNNNSH